jgi:hypothetical protein
VRVYYLNTTLPETLLEYVVLLLAASGIDHYEAGVRSGFVTITGKNGQYFASLTDCETARRKLQRCIPFGLRRLSASFVETQPLPGAACRDEGQLTSVSMNEMATSRGETPETRGKVAVLAVRQEEERKALTALLRDMGMAVHVAYSGKEAILLLEDHLCDLLVLDVQLGDMHAWTMLGTLKEIINLAHLPTLVLMDEQSVSPLYSVTPVVRPFAMARLRFMIWEIFKST